MQLSFREIEKAFEINEKTLYHWLNHLHMPAARANDQFYFNSVEVLEWALKQRISLTPGALKLYEKSHSAENIIIPALLRGGIHFLLAGNNREEVLNNVLDILPLPAHVARLSLKEMLLSREHVGTTGVGNGIAIPHVKHPVVLAGVEPMVGLFFLEKSVDFAAPDGKDVNTLFVILSSSIKGHLSLLSRLAFCLQDKEVQAALVSHTSREEILAAIQTAESKAVRRN